MQMIFGVLNPKIRQREEFLSMTQGMVPFKLQSH